MSSSGAARWVPIAIAATIAIAVWACDPIDTNPKDVISLAIDTAPAPSIVVGDTMRIGDSTALGRLTGTAYNINGKTLGVPILWLTLDPTIVSTDTFGHVFAAAATDSVPSQPRIVAEAGGLQSLPFMVNIVPRPDSLAHDTTDTNQSIKGFCGLPVTSAFNADLFHVSLFGDSTPIGVDNYLVHWAIASPASLAGKQTGTIADTGLIAYISNASGNPSILDTTKNGGVSTRVLTFGAKAFDSTRVSRDSTLTVKVQATARYQGRPLHNPVVVTVKFTNPRQC